ncbi:hypothetical protein [Pseudoduganella lutea]|uniref:Uncharacterized protein n=1 Tax=Pseudoduganella lutea TaxID=321985 RepID=A0A4P6KZ15_9BURK|nr:hypothetical protein [Pseudoduganella lutea]QBE64144.1 hypothetical protein EWM63_15105 [Pseudoduganella lutea]
MKTSRKRALFYLAEAALIAALLFLPVDSDLRALTAGGLFMHLTNSLAGLLFEWRIAAMEPGSDSIFGISNDTIIKCVMAASIAAMASWPLLRTNGAWIGGVLMLAWGVESLLVHPKQNPGQARVR